MTRNPETRPRILVPIDFSDCSKAALDQAILLARSNDAVIDLLHVQEGRAYPDVGPLDRLDESADPRVIEFARTLGGRELDALLLTVQGSGVRACARLAFGSPWQTILRVAKQVGYGVIVMGTHGRTGAAHLFLGSIAENVIRRSNCPVVTIRRPDARLSDLPAQ